MNNEVSSLLIQYYMIALQLISFYFLIIAISNIIWLKFNSNKKSIKNTKKVSVLIPVRNEEKNIGRCIESFLKQSYPSYEIIILDDHSTDRTWEIICGYSNEYPELVKVFKGKALNDNWYGKPYAMDQLASYATGDYYMFTDADTRHFFNSISLAVGNLEHHKADLLSGYINEKIQSLGEAITVPVIFITSLVIPLCLITLSKNVLFTHAIGQLLLFRKEAFLSVGGFYSVSKCVTEDVGISKVIKENGFKVVFLDLSSNVNCRMYNGLNESFNGLTKNIFDYFKKDVFLLGIVTFLIITFLLLPLYFLPLSFILKYPDSSVILQASVFELIAWSITIYDRKLKWYIALFYPVIFIMVILMGWRNFYKVTFGDGIIWKGRAVK
jgi:chlorobactene glucosyltransferase